MGKARDGSECYTRQNKSGANYVTCEGTQKGGKSKSKSIPPQSARARGRRSAAARKLTTRPEAAGRIETGSLNPGVVMPEGPSASFEGLFGAAAPVEPEEAEQGVNEDILAEVIPGLFEGEGPIGERPIYKEDFLQVLSTISERSAQRESEKQEILAKYEPYSLGQLTKSYKKHYEDTHPGRTVKIPRWVTKEMLIGDFVKEKIPDSYLPETGRQGKTSFKISTRDMNDLKFRWKLFWREYGSPGLEGYAEIPNRVLNAAFTSQDLIDDEEKRRTIFQILEELIGDGYTGLWKNISSRDIKSEMEEYDFS